MSKNRRLFIVFLVLFFEMLAGTIIFQLLPLYLETMGFSPNLIGVMNASVAACEIISVPILGAISDRWGRRRVLLVCQLGTFLSILLMIVAKSPLMIFIAVMLDGFTGGNFAIAQAYVSDLTEPDERIGAFRKVSMVIYLGLALGPLLAGSSVVTDFRFAMAGGALFSFATIFLTYWFLPKDHEVPEHAAAKKEKISWGTYFAIFKAPNLRPFFVLFGLFSIAYMLYIMGLTLFLEHRFNHDGKSFGPTQVSYIFGAIGLYTLVFQGFILGKIQKKWGENVFINSAFISAIIGYFLLGLIQQPQWLFLVLIFTVFANSIIPQTLTGLISKNASSSQQGMVMGMLSAMRSTCKLVMPLAAGFLIQNEFLSAWAWIPCLIYIVALVISLQRKAVISSPSV